MTGHKHGSHKATKVKREDVTEQKRKRKALNPAPAVASPTAAPIVIPHPSSRRPKKKKRVVDPNNLASLRTFQASVAQTFPVKLHDGNLMPWIRASVLSSDKRRLLHTVSRKRPSMVLPL